MQWICKGKNNGVIKRTLESETEVKSPAQNRFLIQYLKTEGSPRIMDHSGIRFLPVQKMFTEITLSFTGKETGNNLSALDFSVFACLLCPKI